MMKLRLLIPIAAATLLFAATGPNSAPNPYRTVENWAKLPKGVHFGQVIQVYPDNDGKTIWVFHRGEPPIMHFDENGNFLKSFGDNMFVNSHGFCIDREGNIWASDSGAKDGKGQQVFKFSPEGKVLMTLGTAGVSGEAPDRFNGVAAIAIAPNGDIFIADGHVNNRVVKYSKDGKFIKTWGKKGTGPGEFNVPHSLAFDSKGRLFVADRSNVRIQIFDQDGKYLEEWKQFSSPSGIFITKDDTMLVADSDSNNARHPGWARGIRIGSARDGKVTAFIPDTEAYPDSSEQWEGSKVRISVSSGPEGTAMDSAGNVYGAEVGPMRLMRYVKDAQ
jgi:sugar lactone lactonase YvrE